MSDEREYGALDINEQGFVLITDDGVTVRAPFDQSTIGLLAPDATLLIGNEIWHVVPDEPEVSA